MGSNVGDTINKIISVKTGKDKKIKKRSDVIRAVAKVLKLTTNTVQDLLNGAIKYPSEERINAFIEVLELNDSELSKVNEAMEKDNIIKLKEEANNYIAIKQNIKRMEDVV